VKLAIYRKRVYNKLLIVNKVKKIGERLNFIYTLISYQ